MMEHHIIHQLKKRITESHKRKAKVFIGIRNPVVRHMLSEVLDKFPCEYTEGLFEADGHVVLRIALFYNGRGIIRGEKHLSTRKVESSENCGDTLVLKAFEELREKMSVDMALHSIEAIAEIGNKVKQPTVTKAFNAPLSQAFMNQHPWDTTYQIEINKHIEDMRNCMERDLEKTLFGGLTPNSDLGNAKGVCLPVKSLILDRFEDNLELLLIDLE